MSAPLDWADKRADLMVRLLKSAVSDEAAHEFVAGYLRLTFCEGRSEGFREGAGIVDRVFEAHKKLEAAP
jgi:hypothetical protein